MSIVAELFVSGFLFSFFLHSYSGGKLSVVESSGSVSSSFRSPHHFRQSIWLW